MGLCVNVTTAKLQIKALVLIFIIMIINVKLYSDEIYGL